jgi:hypothetical protein
MAIADESKMLLIFWFIDVDLCVSRRYKVYTHLIPNTLAQLSFRDS